MKYLILLNLVLNVAAFQFTLSPRKPLVQVVGAANKIDVDYFNPAREIDMEHAHDCAEHYGKCSIEDLEKMRSALHTERLQHQATNFQSPDLAVEIDHRLLEEDLNFQLALLKDEMHTLPTTSSAHFMYDGKPSFSPPPVMVKSPTSNIADLKSGKPAVSSTTEMMMDNSGNTAIAQPKHHDSGMNSFIQKGEEMFLIPNGLSDIAAFGAALLIISLAPFLLSQQQ